MSLKTLMISAALSLAAMTASAGTVFTDCGEIADGATVDCGSVNLAVDGTQFAFEARTADDASSGTLTVDTFVDPFFSTGFASANVLFELATPHAASDYADATATLTFGDQSLDLDFGVTSAATPAFVVAMFSAVNEIVPLELTYAGFEGGEQISVRVSAVPLPAGFLLLGTALGGLGLARRRRKMAA